MENCIFRSFAHTVLSVAAFFVSVIAHAEVRNDEGEASTNINLLKVARGGDEVLKSLGNRLPEVARWYRHSEAEMRALLKREPAIRADRAGLLHFVCETTVAQAPTTLTPPNVASTSIPDSQTFFLHSRPGATRVIFLDCDGHTTSGTSWNSSYTNGADIITPPYDIDGVPGSFSTSELSNIREIWQRVSEDYAPFDVDVTTEDPGVEALRKTSSTDLNYGIRVCIGGSSGAGYWFPSAAGGVAYLNSFTWNSDTPCFVFPAQLGNGYPKYVAEAVSHEVGHTFGLSHDGQTNGTSYYEGHANWAPIMGVGYYKPIVQWSKGEYSLANNTENDLAIISSIAPYRPNDHGADILQASPLTGTAPSATGVIERTGGRDYYSFTTGAGQVSFTLNTDAVSPDLDGRLSIYDSAGNLLASANPTTTLGATLTTTLANGTFYLAVDGVGTGDPTTGYSNYASLGQYALTGSVIATSGQSPIAVATQSAPTSGPSPLTVSFSSAGSYDPDGTIASYNWDFGDGSTSTLANLSHSYNTAGTYTASLIVTDNSGLTGSTTVVINAQSNNKVFVAAITMSVSKAPNGSAATAVVTVKDQTGAVKSGATVSGQWSGVTSGGASATTNTNGQASFKSLRTKNRGTFTFTVNSISLAGFTYDAASNLQTSASIGTP